MMIPTLSIDDLCISFPAARRGDRRPFSGVSLCIAPSECVGIIGESGSGKTQVFMAAMGLLASNAAGQRQRSLRGRRFIDCRYGCLESRPRLEAHDDISGSR